MAKLKELKWSERSKLEKMASVMYPAHASPSAQKQMREVIQKSDGNSAGFDRRMNAAQRMYGTQPKPQPTQVVHRLNICGRWASNVSERRRKWQS